VFVLWKLASRMGIRRFSISKKLFRCSHARDTTIENVCSSGRIHIFSARPVLAVAFRNSDF
jgi:hypothetical protein